MKKLILLFSLSILLVGCGEPVKYPKLYAAEYQGFQNEKSAHKGHRTIDLIFKSDGNQYILRGDTMDRDLLVKGSKYDVEYDKHYHTLEGYDFAKKKQEDKQEE